LAQWPGAGKNTDTVAQLWIGFLDFYSGTFDDRGMVVAVRQREPLTKFEKMWNSRCIAIEDPFELSHNLGTGLSRKMWLYIKKAFIKGRHHFGLPLSKLPAGLKNIQEHFFDSRQLTVGPPPQDRNRMCFQCGRVGHIIASCPTRKDRKVRERTKSLNDKQVEVVQEPEASGNYHLQTSVRYLKKFHSKYLSLIPGPYWASSSLLIRYLSSEFVSVRWIVGEEEGIQGK
jgi:terminal uridylyltransferase